MITKYKPIDLHRKESDVLVIHCSDPRFQSAYRRLIDGLERYHDLLVVPGASKAVVDNPSTIEDIKTLFELHHFEEVRIFDHIDCGAFGKLTDEVATHSSYLSNASKKIKKELHGVKIIPHLLGETQEVKI